MSGMKSDPHHKQTQCNMGYERYKSCIDACIACATMCKYCGSECLKEDDVKDDKHKIAAIQRQRMAENAVYCTVYVF